MNFQKAMINLFPSLPDSYKKQLIDEFNKIIRNFRERRWEPAELNGGKFSEVVYSILKGHTDGSFGDKPKKPQNMVEACKKLELASSFPRSIRIQIPRMLMALYEIRNNRNVGHVGSDVDPNQMDATVVVQMSKWIMGELIRIFHETTTEDAQIIVNNITDRTLPIIWAFDNHVRVLGKNLDAKDKMLALLYSTENSQDIKYLQTAIEYKNSSQFVEKVILKAHSSDLVHYDAKTKKVTISPVGIRYVEENIQMEI
ncbi:hypothetical protein [Breznakiella homolactica]|uniref:Uncharacterized protein n=1 Tax=Breznakiella homolactica TaxID=2798577 RepID=A0A7T7XPY1_9SPIR|nr:hypothetical protein [Breznakiella homolactica]QQO10364.1 hypothetical protein JFL75_05450 [Breznakiella homolactica]